jgi:nucleoside-diphosphate-sugar epimerase
MTSSGYGKGNCTEESPLNPLSEYGVQKCQAEKFVLEHPNSVSLRLATVCGVSPRMRFDLMVNDFVRRLKYEGKISIYEPQFKRNFVHILDVCRCMIYMINPAFTGVYNIGFTHGNISKLELAYAICDILGYNREVVTVGEGKDVDQRDCVISTKKILATQFTFNYNLVDAVKQVSALCDLLSPEEAKLKGNI